ncbi:unnamed protein product [Hydatigera taeniaeformis]|uniref:Ubiquinone biosynthesis protein n=1 Tax=Hydatigena taeniaeformis TaxID=6205 RepID=A0A0R3X2N6_HYDTA|nr:unnamed protein product [Hydatigera taeniaeformis]
MDAITQANTAKIVASLNDALVANDYGLIQRIINDTATSSSCAPWDLMSWLLSKVDDSTVEDSIELQSLLRTNIFELSQSLTLQDGRCNDLLIAEDSVGESSVTLPFDFDYLRGMCDRIFQYPLHDCDDSLFDQFSWLMAALNLAIYVNIRTGSISASKYGVETKKTFHMVALAFNRPDAKGRSTLKTRFLDPLSSDIASISNSCFSWFGTLAICRCSFFTAPQVDRLTSRCSHLMSKTSKRLPVHRSVTTSTTTDSMEGAGCAMGVTESDSDSRTFSMDVKTGSLEEMCERALEVAVTHVPTLGWSRDSFEVACMELDLPPGLHSIAMPRGSIDLVLHFYESRNHRLADVLSKWRKEDAVDGTKYIIGKPNSFGFEAPPPFKTKQETDTFLRHAIEHRLRANDEVYPQWGQAMALLTLPQNIPAAIGLEAQLVDEIWAQAGDRSVDINWYAKRLGLAYVYKLAELFYIQDTSPDHKDTWDFLDRRICDLRAVKEAKVRSLNQLIEPNRKASIEMLVT